MRIISKKCRFRIDKGIHHAATFGINIYYNGMRYNWSEMSLSTHSDMRKLICLNN